MRRGTATLALALCLVGCGSEAPPGEPIHLLTGVMPFDQDECVPVQAGQLYVDPQYGAALGLPWAPDVRTPVMWPPGFTGRRVGSAVVVVDPSGNVVASTGQTYSMAGNFLYQTATGENGIFRRGYVPSPIGLDMVYACGQVSQQPAVHVMDMPESSSP